MTRTITLEFQVLFVPEGTFDEVFALICDMLTLFPTGILPPEMQLQGSPQQDVHRPRSCVPRDRRHRELHPRGEPWGLFQFADAFLCGRLLQDGEKLVPVHRGTGPRQ